MEQYSVFQLAHPLSPKKFWKKVLDGLLVKVILWAMAVTLVTFLYYMWSTAFITNGELTVLGIIRTSIEATIVVLVVYYAAYVLYVRAYIRRYYYDAGEQFVTIKKGVFTPREIHVQYGKIQDVYVDQDLLDRMLGIYDVHIASATYTSGIEAHIDGVEKNVAEDIKTTLLGKITGHASSGQAMPQAAAGQLQPTFSGAISSETYPPSALYLLTSTLKSVGYTLLLVIALFGKSQGELSLSPALLAMAGVVVFTMLYNYIWFKNYSFTFNPDMIVLKTKVIATQETHVPYRTIQDVVMTQGLVERMFGLATVTIQNATATPFDQRSRQASGTRIIAQPVARANEIVAAVRSIIGQTSASSTGL